MHAFRSRSDAPWTQSHLLGSASPGWFVRVLCLLLASAGVLVMAGASSGDRRDVQADAIGQVAPAPTLSPEWVWKLEEVRIEGMFRSGR